MGHIGADGLVTVNGYWDEQDTSKALRVYAKMNETFRFDDGYTYTPAEELSAAERMLATPAGRSAKAGIVGGIAGGAFGLLLAIVLRLKAGRGRTRGEPRADGPPSW
jgi:hypothetical protein